MGLLYVELLSLSHRDFIEDFYRDFDVRVRWTAAMSERREPCQFPEEVCHGFLRTRRLSMAPCEDPWHVYDSEDRDGRVR